MNAVAALRNSLEKYVQDHHDDPSIDYGIQSLLLRTTELIRQINVGLQNDQLDEPSVYRMALNDIHQSYIEILHSSP